MENLYNDLIQKYSQSVFEFCINNNDKGFGYIPLDGKVIKNEGQYFFRTNYLRNSKDEYDDFVLSEANETDNRKYELMSRNPQNVYVNLIMYGEDYSVIIIYSKKSDAAANKEINELTFMEYLKYIDVKSENEFIKNIKKCMSIYNKNHPDNTTNLNKILNS